MRPFVLISQARSGSTMLGSALGQHAQLIMHGEVFGAYQFPLNFYGVDERLPWPTPLEIKLKKLRDADPLAFIEEWLLADCSKTWCGFKLKFEEFDIWPKVVSYISDSRMPIIFLKRRNLLARYVSEVIAGELGSFNSTDNASYGRGSHQNVLAALAKNKATEAITASLRYDELFRNKFTRNPIHRIYYEDALVGWETFFRDICSYMEIDYVPILPLSKKRETALDKEMTDAISMLYTEIGNKEYL